MKRPFVALIALLSIAAFTACEEPSEVYYTDTYPIARIEVEVSALGVTPTPTPPSPTATADEPPTPDAPIVKIIADDVLAKATVKAGGSYTLNFINFDGGRAQIRPDADTEPFDAAFVKLPGQKDFRFLFDQTDYTCVVSHYQSEHDGSLVLFTVDLTEHYKALYPDQNVKQVHRKEYSEHR
ncbi:MAG: hypothetical protein RRY33_05380 [Alistipes sp.]